MTTFNKTNALQTLVSVTVFGKNNKSFAELPMLTQCFELMTSSKQASYDCQNLLAYNHTGIDSMVSRFVEASMVKIGSITYSVRDENGSDVMITEDIEASTFVPSLLRTGITQNYTNLIRDKHHNVTKAKCPYERPTDSAEFNNSAELFESIVCTNPQYSSICGNITDKINLVNQMEITSAEILAMGQCDKIDLPAEFL